MKRELIPKGFSSLKSAAEEILSFDEPKMKFFFYYMGESFEKQAEEDEQKGNYTLCSLGFCLSNKLFSHLSNSVLSGYDDKSLSMFSYEISSLRYDSVNEIFCELLNNKNSSKSKEFLSNIKESLEEIIQITQKMNELGKKNY